jgi:hypothetical protein
MAERDDSSERKSTQGYFDYAKRMDSARTRSSKQVRKAMRGPMSNEQRARVENRSVEPTRSYNDFSRVGRVGRSLRRNKSGRK